MCYEQQSNVIFVGGPTKQINQTRQWHGDDHNQFPRQLRILPSDPDCAGGIRESCWLGQLIVLPVDIWLTSEGREYGRFRKFDESRRIENALREGSARASGIERDPVAPFIDPKGYFESIDNAEAAFRKLLAEQQRAP